MKTIVNSIKFLVWVATISLLITYFISVNKEIGFIYIRSNYISNDFLFAVFSGIFTSTLIVLICELYKYYDTKKRVENAWYTLLASLYGQLLIVRNSVGRYLHNSDESLPMDLLRIPVSNSLLILNNLRGLGYCTFGGNSEMERVLTLFIENESVSLENFLVDSGFLDIAVSEDRIRFMQCGVNPTITSSSEKTHKVLTIINKQVERHLNEVDAALIRIDKGCNDRFDWIQRRNVMSQNILYSKFGGLEDYISKNQL